MPADREPGMAFVLVQHLAPDHKSILTELVKRYTRMRVREVEDGMVVEPNCAYIIPPNRDMAFLGGALQLLEPSTARGLRLPIDFFFRSLAQDQHERAICIVLSGTGSDGTLGVRAIKGAGGMAMAQNPESTEYDGMPRSAIATRMVDFVLPPAEMPAQLISYVAHAFGKAAIPLSPPTPKSEGALKRVFILLRAQTGHDFSHYKQNTVIRCVERRMAISQIDRLDDYVRYLQQSPAEVESLFHDLLIGVTSFFRDPAAFEALRLHVIPQLVEGKPPGSPIRVWVPGCSTGEEAYSIAILLHEHIAAVRQTLKLQVFATDIDARSIDRARAGVYPASVAADIAPERLAQFFVQEPDGSAYRVAKSIRDTLVFSEQDVIKDPPFSRLDLISCRNLLIYVDGELQKKLLPMFHYALKPGGFLFLGTSESVGELAQFFSTIDRQSKLFQRKADAPSVGFQAEGGWPMHVPEERVEVRISAKLAGGSKVSLRDLTERALLQEYAPASVLVDEHGDILYLHGRTGLFLEPAEGEASLNILKMGREGLRQRMMTALHKAVVQSAPVVEPQLRVKTNGSFTTIDLTVQPVRVQGGDAGHKVFLVTFKEAAPVKELLEKAATLESGETTIETASEHEARITALEEDLREKQEYLRTAIEELETSNEELKSTNEEMQSINEELQSTNEELETSKEELQSINEELATVNAELQQKVADLSRVNNDMNNLLAGTGIGTIFVDNQLRIMRFTPTVTQVLNLILTDVGRPVGHVVSNFVGYDGLVEDVQAVLDSLVPREVEAQTRAGAWYTLRIRPYRTLENVIEGAVVTFVDITEQKQARKM